MLHFPLMLWVKLPVVDRIHLQSNKFATSVENKATGDAKLNDISANSLLFFLILLELTEPTKPYKSISLGLKLPIGKWQSFLGGPKHFTLLLGFQFYYRTTVCILQCYCFLCFKVTFSSVTSLPNDPVRAVDCNS